MIQGGGEKEDKTINKYNNMRNRNLMQKKVDTMEATLINLQRIVNTQEPIDIYRQNIDKGLGIIEDLKSMIEAEPLSPGEINKL